MKRHCLIPPFSHLKVTSCFPLFSAHGNSFGWKAELQISKGPRAVGTSSFLLSLLRHHQRVWILSP